MSVPESRPDLEIKILPSWLREDDTPNRYAHFEGRDDGDRRDGRRGDRRDSGDRGSRGPRENRGGPKSQDKRGPRPGGAPSKGPGGPSRDRRAEGGQPRRSDDSRRHAQGEDRRPSIEPAPVNVEFLAEPTVLTNVLRELKTSHYAYSIFHLAKMFLQKPERFRVRLTAKSEEAKLHQAGEDGPVALDASFLEQDAFRQLRSRYYREENVTREAPKGNFASVARCPFSGTLLGPTSHHAFQPALRSLYERRFRNRMSFEEYRGRIESVSDPESIEKWKNESSQVTTFVTLEVENPTTFENAAEMEAHFRKTHLPELLRTNRTVELPGSVAMNIRDRRLSASIRQAFEAEIKFPASLVRSLQSPLHSEGLHVFKHRKKIVLLTPIRPARFSESQEGLSANVRRILDFLAEHPSATKHQLAVALLPATAVPAPEAPAIPAQASEASPSDAAQPSAPAPTPVDDSAKLALASDLHYLVHAGYVLEFQNGSLDLAYPPQPTQPATPSKPEVAAAVVPQDSPAADVASPTPELADPTPSAAPLAPPDGSGNADAAESL